MSGRQYSSKCAVFALAVLFTGSGAMAQQSAGDLAKLDALVISHDAAAILGLVPPLDPITTTISYTAAITELGLDNGLRHTPAYLKAPDAVEERPPMGSCNYTFAKPVMQAEEWYENMFGWGSLGRIEKPLFGYGTDVDGLDTPDWGDLGNPILHHHHATVKLTTRHATTASLPVAGPLPAGRHIYRWTAETMYNPYIDTVLPITITAFMMGVDWKIGKYAKQLKEAAEAAGDTAKAARIARRAKFLDGAAAELITTFRDIGVDVGLEFGVDALDVYKLGLQRGASSSVFQPFTVYDVTPSYFVANNIPEVPEPANPPIVDQYIELEATDLGGVKLDRVRDFLLDQFETHDTCGDTLSAPEVTPGSPNFFDLNQTTALTWYVEDAGPFDPELTLADHEEPAQETDGYRTRFIQNIKVVDTQPPLLLPPPGFAVEFDPAGQPWQIWTVGQWEGNWYEPGQINLGRPRATDLGDAHVQILNDAPGAMELDRRYEVKWRASDSSGNVTIAPPEDPDRYTQVVTVKTAGTNTMPVAVGAYPGAGGPGPSAPIETVSAQEVEITLTGSDLDFLDGRFDPLAFEIIDYPDDGEFVTPFDPFFIEDMRLSPISDGDGNIETFYLSPLHNNAEEFSQLSVTQHQQFLEERYCEVNKNIPDSLLYEPRTVEIDDDGYYYIQDHLWTCQGTWPGPYTAVKVPRISRWSPDGDWLDTWRTLQPIPAGADYQGDPDHDNPSVAGTYQPEFRFWLDSPSGQIWWYTDNSDYPFYKIDAAALSGVDSLGSVAGDVGSIVDIAGIAHSGLLYVVTANGAYLYDADAGMAQIGTLQTPLGPVFANNGCDGSGKNGVVVDHGGFVFLLEGCENRIHKYGSAARDDNDAIVVGDYVGWLGSCSANTPQGATPVLYNACNVDLGISKGYACDDTKCVRDADTRGAEVGQFDSPGHLAIDDHGLLYVADVVNQRLQRFGTDGTFAGKAVSEGNGIFEDGFILGNFGMPQQMSANGHQLFLLETNPALGDYFVHMFKTVPFYNLTDASATVKYVSDFNYQGTEQFSFRVTDGIAPSSIKPVNVTVKRAYRAPNELAYECYADQAQTLPVVDCGFDEDTELYILVSANDPDGIVDPAGLLLEVGLDWLNFEIIDAVTNGTLTQLESNAYSALYRYTPDADYFGGDTFSFRAFDGHVVDGDGNPTEYGGYSAETQSVGIIVNPVFDEYRVDLPAGIVARRGFPVGIQAPYVDPDADVAKDFVLDSIDWGDGSPPAQESGGTWSNHGLPDLNGSNTSPVIEYSETAGQVLAAHTYTDAGGAQRTFVICHDSTGPVTPRCLPETLDIVESTQVVAALSGSPVIALDGGLGDQVEQPFDVNIDVTNLLPSGWAGLPTQNLSVDVDLPDGVSVVSAAACGAPNTQGVMTCAIGDLAQGATATLQMTVSMTLDQARLNGRYGFLLSMTDDNLAAAQESLALLAMTVDRDGDGVIDADDPFPDNPEYVADTDADGIADAYEEEYGDVHGAHPPTHDEDGDGLTQLEEFLYGGSPVLAETEALDLGTIETIRAAVGTGDDNFGRRVSGGDLNGDGYSDVVIGGHKYGSNGAFFVSYGSENGADTAPVAIEPTLAQTSFGIQVIVGDWNDDGFNDVAVASTNAISVFTNNGVDQQWLAGNPDVISLGYTPAFVLTADIDNDGADDLLLGDKGYDNGGATNAGAAQVYRSSGGPLIAGRLPDFTFTLPLGGIAAGDSIAVGDFDGDGLADLALGSSFSGLGSVGVYLGSNFNMNSGSMTTAANFVISGSVNQFGFDTASGVDVTGDGVDDLVVGAYHGQSGATGGVVYVFRSETLIANGTWTTHDQFFNGPQAGTQHGVSVAVADILPAGSVANESKVGSIVGAGNRYGADVGYYALYSGNTAAGDPSVFPNDERIGDTSGSHLGYFTRAVGDVNGDGLADFAVGAPSFGSAAGGFVELIYGALAPASSSTDVDGDGVDDNVDNCVGAANPDQAVNPIFGLAVACDDDDDGAPEIGVPFPDNCPGVPNDTQQDWNNNLIGDACEDFDGDGVLDENEFDVTACPETEPLGSKNCLVTNPDGSTDNDNDFLPDEWEIANGLPDDVWNEDTDQDRDGVSDLDEYLNGTPVFLPEYIRPEYQLGGSTADQYARTSATGFEPPNPATGYGQGFSTLMLSSPNAPGGGNVVLHFFPHGGDYAYDYDAGVNGFDWDVSDGSWIDAPTGVDGFGRTMTMGDYDGNGFNDYVVSSDDDRIFVYFVDATAEPVDFGQGPDFSPPIDGTYGVTELELPAPASACGTLQFGSSMVTDDVDHDGIDDLLISAPIWCATSNSDNGAVLVYLSSTGWTGQASPAPSHRFEGLPSGTLGQSLITADVDGDGLRDVLAGSLGGTSHAAPAQGGWVAGFLGSNFAWESTVTQPDFVLGTDNDADAFGLGLDVGDVDGDGIDDLVVGAYTHPETGPKTGAVHFYSSRTEYWQHPVTAGVPTQPTQTVVSDETGHATNGPQLGVRLIVPGDVNGDGYADVIAGANRANVAGGTDNGEVSVYAGSPDGLIDPPIADDALYGTGPENYGWYVGRLHDLDGDGADEALAYALNSARLDFYLSASLGGAYDTDGDQVMALFDNCRSVPNPNQLDSNSDGVGDLCDDDGDSVDVALDNCPLIYNPAQGDADNDGIGDVCDDSDGDGVVDPVDAFPIDPRGTIDTDGDGMPDEWELANGLNPNDASDASGDLDPDSSTGGTGDGLTNLEEYLAGTAPRLYDHLVPAGVLTSGSGTVDWFGYSIAVGQIDDLSSTGTGIDSREPVELLVGAPKYNGVGAAFLYFSSNASGERYETFRIDPPATPTSCGQVDGDLVTTEQTNFGRAVAIGLIDDDDFMDIAIASDNAVNFYLSIFAPQGPELFQKMVAIPTSLAAVLGNTPGMQVTPVTLCGEPGDDLGSEMFMAESQSFGTFLYVAAPGSDRSGTNRGDVYAYSPFFLGHDVYNLYPDIDPAPWYISQAYDFNLDDFVPNPAFMQPAIILTGAEDNMRLGSSVQVLHDYFDIDFNGGGITLVGDGSGQALHGFVDLSQEFFEDIQTEIDTTNFPGTRFGIYGDADSEFGAQIEYHQLALLSGSRDGLLAYETDPFLVTDPRAGKVSLYDPGVTLGYDLETLGLEGLVPFQVLEGDAGFNFGRHVRVVGRIQPWSPGTDSFDDALFGDYLADGGRGQVRFYRGSPVGMSELPLRLRGANPGDGLGWTSAKNFSNGHVNADVPYFSFREEIIVQHTDMAVGAPFGSAGGYVQILHGNSVSAPDADGDFVDDTIDNCIYAPNPDQDPGACDADGDGVDLPTDNCPLIVNPSQADNHGGPAGDACEDTDGDGVLDANDLWADDVRYFADTDGDGLPDAWETANGLDPNVSDGPPYADADGDTFDTLAEFQNDGRPFLPDGVVAELEFLSPPQQLSVGWLLDDRFGQQVTTADINGDGYDDAIVGAPLYETRGAVLIGWGGVTGITGNLTVIPAGANDLSFGRSIAVGNFDGDATGCLDIAIASSDDVSVYLATGGAGCSDTNWLANAPARVVPENEPGENFGAALHAVDVDADGTTDLFVSATEWDGPGSRRGNVYVYLNADYVAGPVTPTNSLAGTADNQRIGIAFESIDYGGGLRLVTSWPFSASDAVGTFSVDPVTGAFTPDITIFPSVPGVRFGYSLAVDDYNNDGVEDLAVGGYGGTSGNVYVYDGASGLTNWSLAVGNASGDQLGVGAASGDFDNDGYADVISGANRAGATDEGYFRVDLGNDTGAGGAFEFGPAPRFEHDGVTRRDMLGYSVSTGDFNNDGHADVLVGAPDIAVSGYRPDSGFAEVRYFGGDGVADALDNCPDVNNTDQANLDGDGFGDACDNDVDGDGVDNGADNCPVVFNGQGDLDGDGIGDACDDDRDGDGYANADDLWPDDGTRRRDGDGDGLSDTEESVLGTILTNPDSDGDTVGDAAEVAFGSNPLSVDSDGDGVLDDVEFASNTNPNDQSPMIAITSPADGFVLMQGDALTAVATAADPEDGDLDAAIRWFVDGVDTGATGPTYNFTPPWGAHTIEARVEDSSAGGTYSPQTATASISIDVQPLGDVDGDGVLTPKDVLLIQRHVIGLAALTGAEFTRADVYPVGGDGQLTISDLLFVQRNFISP